MKIDHSAHGYLQYFLMTVFFCTIFIGVNLNAAPGVATDPEESEQPNFFVVKDESYIYSSSSLNIEYRGILDVVYSSDTLIEILDIRDYDRDGYLDVVFVELNSGNCCPFPYTYLSFRPPLSIKHSELGYYWSAPSIEESDDHIFLVGTRNNQGANFYDAETVYEKFIFKDGEAIKISEEKVPEIYAIAELRSSEFELISDRRLDSKITLKYDVNGDGLQEIIECTLWERWGAMHCSLYLPNGHDIDWAPGACKRVGVLSNKSNGMHDLVCDQNEIHKWNGERYSVF